MKESSNRDKSKHGKNAQSNLVSMLDFCKRKKYIKDYTTPFRIGKDGFSNKNQFYSPFLIVFDNNEQWVVFTTTSMRTDRVKGQQWDSLNIKNIKPSVSKSYLVYQDCADEFEVAEFKRQNAKYQKKEEYSAIDAILNQSELYALIEAHFTISLEKGKIKNIQGRNFEDFVAEILSDKDNFKKWQNDDKTLTGMNYPLFFSIVDSLSLHKNQVENIEATTDKKSIGKLPSGGIPKTDIILYIRFKDGSCRILTVSCKRSSAKSVSIHEYSADSFAETIDDTNQRLRLLLNLFQRNPSLKSFGTKNEQELTMILKPYCEKLAKWALAGVYGSGDPIKQWVTHLLTYDNNDGSITFRSIDDYIGLLKSLNVTGNFGTYFSWTYPSKKKGKSIQLKCKILK